MNDSLSRLALALGIGLLIGLERGWSTRQGQPGSRAAGARTFAITGLLGGIVGTIARPDDGVLAVSGSLLIGVGLAVYACLIASFSRDENRAKGRYSATTAIAAVLTFMLGVYACLGDIHIAAACAVAATGLLALREGIHAWIEKMTRSELESALVLLAMTFIVLPIVPGGAIDAMGGINIRELWIIAIALASVSFAAYVAVKYFGEERGVLVSAAIGGLISSTAVAFTSARSAAAGEGSPRVLSAGTALAMAVSFARVTAIVCVLASPIALDVGVALGASALVASAYAVRAVRGARAAESAPAGAAFRNPFGFWSVIGLAVTMGALVFLGRYINDQFGEHGVLAGAATMGLFDVDAMTVSMAGLITANVPPVAVAHAILIGVASNTLIKVIIAAVIGRGRFAIDVALVALGCLAAGTMTTLIVDRVWF